VPQEPARNTRTQPNPTMPTIQQPLNLGFKISYGTC